MAEKLGIGDVMPEVAINVTDGSALDLPSGLDARYKVILFYRGHW